MTKKTLRIHKETTIVGDVEVTTAIRVPTPEHDKLALVSAKSQAIGDFIDWLAYEKHFYLCTANDDNRYYHPIRIQFTKLLAEYFEIDEAKLEAEKVALLEAIRR